MESTGNYGGQSYYKSPSKDSNPANISKRSRPNQNTVTETVAIPSKSARDIEPVPEAHPSSNVLANPEDYESVLGVGSSSPPAANHDGVTVMNDGPAEQFGANFNGMNVPSAYEDEKAIRLDIEVNNNTVAQDEDTRSDISDDSIAWNVDSYPDYPYPLAFNRLAALGNLTRQDSADLTIDPADLESYLDEGGVWAPNAVLQQFQNGGFRIDHAVFRTLFRNPRIRLGTIVERPASPSQRRRRLNPPSIAPSLPVKYGPADEDESGQDAPNATPYGQYVRGVPSSHPTGQVPREGETFEEDTENPGQWLVRFLRQLPNGTAYEQVDHLRNFDPTAISTIPTNEIGSELGGDPMKIPTPAKYGTGFWIKLENQPKVGRAYRRHYNVPPECEHRALHDSEAHVEFILRRFDRITGQYTMQYKWGESWDAWNRNVSTFDINDMEMCRTFNRWLNQVKEKNGSRYEKRGTRECWKEYELILLRGHFNQLIEQQGLIQAHSKVDWQLVVNLINNARLARDPNATLRNENGVSSQAERDTYSPSNPRMGTHEWRQLGSQLRALEKKHPGLKINDDIMKPHNCIPMDDIKEKRVGGNEVSRQWKAAGVTRKDALTKAQTKIIVSYNNGLLWIADRFDGALVHKHFGGLSSGTGSNGIDAVTIMPADNRVEEEPVWGGELDQQESDVEHEQGNTISESEDECEEPAPKRQKH